MTEADAATIAELRRRIEELEAEANTLRSPIHRILESVESKVDALTRIVLERPESKAKHHRATSRGIPEWSCINPERYALGSSGYSVRQIGGRWYAYRDHRVLHVKGMSLGEAQIWAFRNWEATRYV